MVTTGGGLPLSEWERQFGPPEVAAADLHELRLWGHKRTALTPNEASSKGRELICRIDPSWPARALTNERIKLPEGRRPRSYGVTVNVAQSTMETVLSVADGVDPPSTVRRPAKNFETLWPAQSNSWRTWVYHVIDVAREDCSAVNEMTSDPPRNFIQPVHLLLAVRDAAAGIVTIPALHAYFEAIADRMVLDRQVWKFATTVFPGDGVLRGLVDFRQSWLDQFPGGDLALWLRSLVCNGWATSHQVAAVMGLPTARSTKESWI